MAATDTPYRKQRTLDIVFGVSCVLLLISTVWMFWQDYNRDWKAGQRQFRDIEEALTERAMLEKLPNKEQLADARAAVDEQKQKVNAEKASNQAEVGKLPTDKAKADADYAGLKATYDSKASLYVIEVDKSDEAETEGERASLEKGLAKPKAALLELKKQLDEAAAKVEELSVQ